MALSSGNVNNPLFFPSSALIQQNGTAGNGGATIDGGLTTGDVFQGRGGDFLDPSDIQGTLNGFGSSIGGSSMIFGDNPNFLDVHNITTKNINKIFKQDFFPAFNNVNILNAPYIQPVPALTGNVSAGDVLSASTFFQLGVELSPNLYSPQQFNPYLWNGPSANDIFTGSLISQNNILGGNFSWPNNFPNSLIGTGGVHMGNPFPQFTGLPFFGDMFGNPYSQKSPFNSLAGGLLGQGYNGGGMFGDGLMGSYPGLYASPLAGGTSLQSSGSQLNLMDYIFGQSQGLMGNMSQSLFGGLY